MEKWNAILYNKRKRVLQVRIEQNKITDIGELYDPAALPIILQHKLDLESINKWLSKRKMPDNREGLTEVKNIYGAFENYRNMFSLTDQYWFKRSNKDSWDKLNFFSNKYSTAVGRSLFTPWAVNKDEISKQSPDLTTNGVLRKMWIQDDDMTSYLIKAGSKKFHQEPLSEVLASLLLHRLHIVPYVEYELCVYGLRICSKCKNFVTKDTEFVPAQYIYSKEPRLSNETKYEHFVRMCGLYEIKNVEHYLDHMILADIIIGNDDRHLGNFGFLRDVNTGKFIGFSPLFDFGSAFCEYNADKKTTSENKVFADQEHRVLITYGYEASIRILEDYTPLFNLIDMYPNLTEKQKDAIKGGIKKRAARFKNGFSYKKEMIQELDRTI